jgi:hypothetical protein
MLCFFFVKVIFNKFEIIINQIVIFIGRCKPVTPNY